MKNQHNPFIGKCQKKAYDEIRKIGIASNMVSVEGCINDALCKTFGLWNLGLVKIAMRKNKSIQVREYGAEKYKGNFDLLKAIRTRNLENHGNEVRKYLMSFVPEILKSSAMYKQMASE